MSAAQGPITVSSSFLQPGQVFKSVEVQEVGLKCTIRIQLLICDLENGSLSGTIHEDRKNEVNKNASFDTAKTWEGQIIDNRNWSLQGRKLNATENSHIEKCKGLPEFRSLAEVLQNEGGSDASLDLANNNYIFIRLEERGLRKISIDKGILVFDYASQTHHACLFKTTGMLTTQYKTSTGETQIINFEPHMNPNASTSG